MDQWGAAGVPPHCGLVRTEGHIQYLDRGGKYLTCLFCGSRSDLMAQRARPFAYFYGSRVSTSYELFV